MKKKKAKPPVGDTLKVLASGPLSMRARHVISDRITSGVYPPGTRLPGESELAKELGVSRVTLREALKEMEFDGLIRRQHGVGTFVSEEVEKIEYKIEDNLGAVEMLGRLGVELVTSRVEIDDAFYDPEIGKVFGDRSKRLVTIRRVRSVKGRPIVTVLDALPWKRGIDYAQIETRDMTVFDFAKEILGMTIGDGKAVLMPNRANKTVARDLELSEGSLVMELEQIDYQKNGAPLLYSLEWWSPSLVKFTASRRRPADRT